MKWVRFNNNLINIENCKAFCVEKHMDVFCVTVYLDVNKSLSMYHNTEKEAIENLVEIYHDLKSYED